MDTKEHREIEKEIMGGEEPILFTGRENVPDQIKNYLKSSDIETLSITNPDVTNDLKIYYITVK